MTASPSDLELTPEMMTQFMAALQEAGLQEVSVRHDGRRLLLEGCADSFDCKSRAVEILRPMVKLPILNCIRVHPV